MREEEARGHRPVRGPRRRSLIVLYPCEVVKGDRVEILVDTGNGVRGFEVLATREGRRVDVLIARGTVEVAEVTRGGQVVRSARFMSSRVVAVVEHPASQDAPGG